MKKAFIIIGYSVLAVALIAALVWGTGERRQKELYETHLNALYQKSYYDLVDNMNNLEARLAKVLVSSDKAYSNELLTEIWRQSDSAADNLGQMPLGNDTLQKASRYINQLGAYSKSLSVNGMDEEAEKQLETLYGICVSLNKELNAAAVTVIDFSGTLLGDETKDNAMPESFKSVGEVSIDYPKLIYDGPFTDSLESKEPKFLSGEKLDAEQAVKKLEEFLGDIKLSETSTQADKEGEIPAYYISAKGSDGSSISAAVSEEGGIVIWLSRYLQNYEEPKLSEEKCAEKAVEFAHNRGFSNMTPVFAQQSGLSTIVNLAATQEDVILYPDLIKVKVSSVDGSIELWEARNYIMSHTERSVSTPKLSLEQAKAKLSDKLSIKKETGLVLIPLNNKEILCYEFICSYENNKYYVYIDAATGDTRDIYRVIGSGESEAVM